MKISFAAATLAGLMSVANLASAGPIPYANVGVQNPTTYVFTAANTGNITAYFFASTAGYMNDLSLLVNGVDTGIHGLNNQTSAKGLALDFGSVNAGDILVFRLNNIWPGNVGPWYSDKAMNSDGVNHVYSTDFAGDALVPAGTFVSFEDLPGGGDLNYNDEDFVFTNVRTSTGVPEPASALLLMLGLGGLLLARRQSVKA